MTAAAATTTRVNRALTARPRRREVVENDEYGAFARRIVTSYARRVAAGDVEALPRMLALSAHLDEAIGQAVVGLRGFGYSWAEIGARLGLTRQAVQQRWGTASDGEAR
jgi:DNA-directed RNA polymerase specialized sigma24 family protein